MSTIVKWMHGNHARLIRPKTPTAHLTQATSVTIKPNFLA